MKAFKWAGISWKTSRILIVVFVLLWACKASNQPGSTASSPVLMSIGEMKVPLAEFKYIYDKNNTLDSSAYSEKSINEYLDLFVNFKLKVYEAKQLGMDTTHEFREELSEYKKTLAKPYFTDTTITRKLIVEAYNRLKEEIRASHILIGVAATAEPKDTLAAYEKIRDLRKRAVAGEDFGELAYFYSEDPSAKSKPGDPGHKGDLGYFTALQMIYSFEDAAYKTPVGQISPVIRTQYGYHIIKVAQRRISNGSVKVAHIMVRATEGISPEDSMAAYNKIIEIENRLRSGTNWKLLVEQFSDDLASKNQGGELQWFTAGNMIPVFEEAAFSLRNPGDLSPPVHTPYGWHIIKLIEKRPLEPFEELEPALRQKVSKDSRSELNRTSLLRKLRKENKLSENEKASQLFSGSADSLLTMGKWKYNTADKNLDKVLFTINRQKHTLKDFFTFVQKTQQPQQSISPAHYMNLLYQSFLETSLLDYEEAHLEEKYPEYRYLVNEYHDGILLFKIMEQNVWTKAITDSEGLEKYFEKFRSNYKWPTRVRATIYSADREETLNQVKEEAKKDYYVNEEVRFGDTRFTFNSTDLTQQEEAMLGRLADYMKKDTSTIVELRVYSLRGEKGDILFKRISKVKDFLVLMGVQKERLAEAKISAPGSMAGVVGNDPRNAAGGAIQYLIYSKSKKVLEQKFNKANPLAVQITEGLFQRGEHKILDELNWKEGNYTVQRNNRVYYIEIHKVEAERNKTLAETRGTVVSDYQNFLEQEWIKSLKNKYKVEVNREVTQKMIKK